MLLILSFLMFAHSYDDSTYNDLTPLEKRIIEKVATELKSENLSTKVVLVCKRSQIECTTMVYSGGQVKRETCYSQVYIEIEKHNDMGTYSYLLKPYLVVTNELKSSSSGYSSFFSIIGTKSINNSKNKYAFYSDEQSLFGQTPVVIRDKEDPRSQICDLLLRVERKNTK